MKKKLLVVALGYPTKENPFEASFFKEQVDFLSDSYDCTVVVCRERSSGLIISGKTTITTAEYTPGIPQYYPTFGVSKARKLIEALTGLYDKKKRPQTAVGIYRSEYYREYRKKRIAEFIKEYNMECDAVYCITAQGAAFYAHKFAEIMDKPLLISEHRPYPHPGWATIDVEKEAFEYAKCYLAISKDKIRQVMLQNIRPQRVACIGNLVDETLFTYNPIAHEYPTFVIVAACSYFKNLDLFIEVFNKLCDKTDKPFRVIIAGYKANIGYIEAVDEFERKLSTSKFADRLELIAAVPRNELSDLYNRCDAFIMTSIQEGQPMVALEAACCGLPIFSTRCGGVEDYVTDEIGRLTDITDSDKMSDYLMEYLDDIIIFDGQIIRDRVVSLYGREAFRRNICAEIERVCTG